ncbi:hypothetical protein MN032_08115 [Agromyces atrinae]|uniref:hypothetical protein n=1 Tax=Agromyces atrinae TaxID=592376 RepID=UPI001F5A4C3C|nr:hypothetical protein [Agromyces atrinae]MCI2957654.1 hypothetical protein [Agromyces atrinae]
MSRSSTRAARRADRSGSGPTLEGSTPARYPGATNWFALLGEVLLVGILVAVASLPLLTLPAALAAGVRHMRRHLLAEDSKVAFFWADVKRGLVGGIGIGAAVLVLVLVLLLDIDIASSGALPGGELIAIVGWVGLPVVAVALFVAAGAWSPELRWRGAVRSVPRLVRADTIGALYLVATAVFAVVVTWQLLPLIIPALGCVALAIVAIPARPRRSRIED